MRQAHTPPRVTAVVLNRLYPQLFSLEDAVLHIAASAGPDAGGAAAVAGGVRTALPRLVLPGDPRAFSYNFLQRTVVAVPPDAPRLQGQQLRLSQRSTQEQVRSARRPGSDRVEPPRPSRALLHQQRSCPLKLHHPLPNF